LLSGCLPRPEVDPTTPFHHFLMYSKSRQRLGKSEGARQFNSCLKGHWPEFRNHRHLADVFAPLRRKKPDLHASNCIELLVL
jgi:hypothetical protein